MAAGSTYTPIATTTLGSATTSVTLSSIPSTYTDLVFIANFSNTTNTDIYMRVNGDSSSIYSATQLYGNGSSAGSTRFSNTGVWVLDPGASGVGTGQANLIVNIQNYANTSVYKTSISRANAASTVTGAIVGLWRSTAAINSVTLFGDFNFSAGSTFTLYGIQAA